MDDEVVVLVVVWWPGKSCSGAYRVMRAKQPPGRMNSGNLMGKEFLSQKERPIHVCLRSLVFRCTLSFEGDHLIVPWLPAYCCCPSACRRQASLHDRDTQLFASCKDETFPTLAREAVSLALMHLRPSPPASLCSCSPGKKVASHGALPVLAVALPVFLCWLFESHLAGTMLLIIVICLFILTFYYLYSISSFSLRACISVMYVCRKRDISIHSPRSNCPHLIHNYLLAVHSSY